MCIRDRYKGNTLTYMLKSQFLEWNKDSTQRWRVKDYEIRTYYDSLESITLNQGKFLDTMLNMLPSDFEFYACLLYTSGAVAGAYYGSNKLNLLTLKYFLAFGLSLASIKLLFT